MSNTSPQETQEEPTSSRSPLAKYPPYSDRQKSRASEFYGFVAWTSTYICFVLYVLWALLPDAWIEGLGIDWYPSREWAILLPAYSVVLVLLTYFTYWAIALYNTPSFDDLSTIADSHGHIPNPPSIEDGELNPYLAAAEPNAIPEPYDIPIELVNRILYSQSPRASEEGI